MNTSTKTPAIVYTEEQQAAITKLVNLIRDREYKEIRLVGSAGTGKSQSLKEIIRQLEEDDEDITIVAPTHKAKKVAANFINADREEEDMYEPITLAKALGKIPDVKVEDGRQVFVQRKVVPELQGVIIVDEASMISAEDLEKLNNLLTPESIILYILDPVQLPPINTKGDVPPVYDLIIPEATLTTPMRFYAQSNIGTITSVIRNKQVSLSDVNWKNFSKVFQKAKDIKIYTDETLFQQNLINDMIANNWHNNPNSIRCLSYTNYQVDKYNDHVKLEYFNNDSSSPVNGEVFIAKKPFSRKTPDDTPNEIFAATKPIQFIQNGEEFTIIELLDTGTFVHPKYTNLPIDYERWSCLKEDDTQFVANLVQRKSESNFNKIDADLTDKALKAKNYKSKRVAWAKRYAFIECFDNCRRAYALTVHSSQGSTFEHIYFDMSSMLGSANSRRIRRALCYTAMTRPTTSMSLYIPPMYLM